MTEGKQYMIKINVYRDVTDADCVGYQIDGSENIYPFSTDEDTFYSTWDIGTLLSEEYGPYLWATRSSTDFELVQSVMFNPETSEVMEC